MTVTFQQLQARPQGQPQSELFNEWILPDGTTWTSFYKNESEYLLRFPDLADFMVSRDGCHISCWPTSDISSETIQHLYLNQVLPLALSKQGKLVLHASVVEINNTGIVFMGKTGSGKSTMAASFATNGYRFLTDDALVLELRDGTYQIIPGHPSIRLWQDSEDALICENTEIASPVKYTSKTRVLAGDHLNFCEYPIPLRHVYFLGDEDQGKLLIKNLKPNEALIELIKNSFLLDIKEKEMLGYHFQELSKLVKQPIFYRLDYPRRFQDLAHVRQAIFNHLDEKDDEI